jgi:hypothetical protein
VKSSGEIPLEPVTRLVRQCRCGSESKEQEDPGYPRAFAG